MNLSRDQIGGLFMLLFSTTYALLIGNIPELEISGNNTGDFTTSFSARSMPTVLAILGILFSLILLLRGTTHQESRLSLRGLNIGLGILFLILMVLYSVAIRPAGFLLSTFVFLFAGFWCLGERRVLKSLGIAGVVSVVFWLLMSQVLDVYLEPWPEIFVA